MNNLKVELKNCFGINHLEHNFNFNQEHSFLIYAPNGMMKSSFAKTFNLLAKNQKPCDQVYPGRETIANILCDEKTIVPEYIFVADAEADITTNDKVTTLLASKKLKTQYDSIYQQLDETKSDFVKKIKSISQSTDCEEEIITTFAESKKDNFFECLEHAKNKVSSTINVFDFKYNDIFDKKGNVKKFLDKNKDLIQKYFEEYKRLITNSYFFSDNTNGPSFGTYQAKKLIDSVTGVVFFVAKHKIVLSNLDEISSSSMLEDLVNNEMNRILSDEKIKKAFEKIDNAIGANAELRAFKNVIEKDKSLIPYLTDYENFKKMVWYGYLYKTNNEYLKSLNLHNTKKHELAELLKEAKKENVLWSWLLKENLYKKWMYCIEFFFAGMQKSGSYIDFRLMNLFVFVNAVISINRPHEEKEKFGSEIAQLLDIDEGDGFWLAYVRNALVHDGAAIPHAIEKANDEFLKKQTKQGKKLVRYKKFELPTEHPNDRAFLLYCDIMDLTEAFIMRSAGYTDKWLEIKNVLD